jgi:hypothetical protein
VQLAAQVLSAVVVHHVGVGLVADRERAPFGVGGRRDEDDPRGG